MPLLLMEAEHWSFTINGILLDLVTWCVVPPIFNVNIEICEDLSVIFKGHLLQFITNLRLFFDNSLNLRFFFDISFHSLKSLILLPFLNIRYKIF